VKHEGISFIMTFRIICAVHSCLFVVTLDFRQE